MQKTLPILYSRTSKGQIQTWTITVDGATFFTKEGIKGGAISESKPTICKAKNVGRANETTPEQQAEAEAQAKWQKKLDSGYHEDESKIDEDKFFEPMTAHKWPDYKDDAVYPVFSQPKLDGMRCVTTINGMTSRKGKPVKSAPHIREAFQEILDLYPELVIDGELYNHEFKHNFNKIISLAKKIKPSAEELAESRKKLQYWVYDIFNPTHPDMGFEERSKFLLAVSMTVPKEYRDMIVFVPTKKVETVDELDALFASYVDQGYEGQMIRTDSKYENKRTKSLLKRKDFIDEEYELVDLEEGLGNRAGLATRATFKLKNSKDTFEAGVIGNNEYTADLLKNKAKYIGKPGTVCYFNLTPDGKPRFGKMKIIRDYE